jgi:predicted N-formylglutamate amidohydrolase
MVGRDTPMPARSANPATRVSLAALPPEAAGYVPFRVIAGKVGGGLLVVCDHADNALPEPYGSLGLPPPELTRHIAYDPGAAAVSEGLARRLGAPAVLSRFSRLLIDANRGEDDPTLIMRLSDGTIIPGNAHVDAAERARRIAGFHAPYHAAVDAALDAALATGVPPAIVSIHSFTPVWRGKPRPWHAGVLWDADHRLALPLLKALRADEALVVGDNEPYSGAVANDSMWRHGAARGLANVIVEVRQDLISDPAGAEAWAARLAGLLEPILAEPELHQIRHYRAHAGGGPAPAAEGLV